MGEIATAEVYVLLRIMPQSSLLMQNKTNDPQELFREVYKLGILCAQA